MNLRFLKRILQFSILFLLILFGGTFLSIGRFSKIDQTQKADVAIILGTAVWGNEPSPVFEQRILHGIKLYQDGWVDYLIFTGGSPEIGKPSEAEVAKSYAVKKGILIDKIFIEDQSRITQENLVYSKEILTKNTFSTVLIVSDPIHMRRAMTMASDLELVAYSSPTQTSQFRSASKKFGFLLRETYLLIGYKVLQFVR